MKNDNNKKMKIPYRRILILASPFILILALIHSCYPLFPDKNRPREGESISYWSPVWVSNDRIMYIKWKERASYVYGFLANIADSGRTSLGVTYQICSSNLEGKNEKVIISFMFNKQKNDQEEIDLFKKLKGTVPRYLDYNAKKDLIVFSGDQGPIFLLNGNGKGFHSFSDVQGFNPRISSDGNKLLYQKKTQGYVKNPVSQEEEYHLEYSFWIVNIDGTDNKKILTGSGNAIWYPDGNKVIFYRSPGVYILNLNDGSEEVLFSMFYEPFSITNDLSKIVLGRDIFDFKTKEKLKITNIPDGALFSPDGQKILGSPLNMPEVRIGIFNLKTQKTRKIFENCFKTLR